MYVKYVIVQDTKDRKSRVATIYDKSTTKVSGWREEHGITFYESLIIVCLFVFKTV